MADDGSYKPFPGNRWNEWGEGKNPLEHFVDVNSIFADGRGSLWVVDAAAPGFAKGIGGAAKLVQIDLATDQVVRSIPFDAKTMGENERFGHLRIHGDHGFLTESKTGAFVIVNLTDGSYRKVLSGHPLMRCEPQDVPVIEGRKLQRGGKPAYIHNDLLEISADGKTLYFCCLFGRKMFQIPLSIMKDTSASDETIAANISVAFKLDGPWIAGMCRDSAGNLYFTDAENNALRKRDRNGVVTVLLKDPLLIWPIAPSIDPEGNLYVTATQLNRVAMFNDGVDKVERPWRMFKLQQSGG
jgi:sugar lactone lactonase YvrE